ncbi:MAG: Pyruvate carboxylase subunit B [Candidatus Methanofastidiosum methylothiophilum]|uniref:Pyruvate carboxylase subunit B n=1 Tax=Candidatus Methanofastidiosum methylothiophilum TaxID=1705564 RepID=A0A150J198_9EURY|nr:MAG: Pyruvate carboxylase subunit B [Candidatus Methanofastidiosum methylthiophilus]KYC48318.1 MAG: Pyruvate carboxylase subunit B [Candidatus Methanofastidiosum methylthiophilus]KYC50987.1 MAG: Pyruvate carboxylase subunit B [Candidatus Methanofastidiosum methylthiophilus]
MPKVKITDTTLRDAHQSLIATRLGTEDMLEIVGEMDKVGFHSFEMWGGATFDSAIRYLNEDPWERITKLKEEAPKTPFQMLLRGQNLVGYKHYPDDIVHKFVEASFTRGIDIFRIFDALNDIRNMEVPIEAIKKVGGHAQGALSYTISPVHTIEYYIKVAEEMVGLEIDSICIKDMAGLINPMDAYNLVKSLKENFDLPVCLHSHCTSGMAPTSYFKAIEAGVDIIDTAIGPFSFGTSQPGVETMYAMLENTEHKSDLDIERIYKIANYLKKLRDKHKGLLSEASLTVNTQILHFQIPGGMMSNLVSQLKEQNAENRLDEILLEVPKVRAELGYPPLVTPLSQIVGAQATLNVLSGQRYKLIPNEVKNYVKGLYGKPAAPINKDIQKIIIGDEKVSYEKSPELKKPSYQKFKDEVKDKIEKEEDVISYALFPEIVLNFFETRKNKVPTPKVEHKEVEKAAPKEVTKQQTSQQPHTNGGVALRAPLPGAVLKIIGEIGKPVKKDSVLFIISAMKMENEIVSPASGVLQKVYVKEGDVVKTGDVLATIA